MLLYPESERNQSYVFFSAATKNMMTLLNRFQHMLYENYERNQSTDNSIE